MPSAATSFGKLSRAIIVAAQEGGGDPDHNAALAAGHRRRPRTPTCPTTTSTGPSRRAAGPAPTARPTCTSRTKATGPNGVAIYVTALTDNRTARRPTCATSFDRAGGKLGTDGSVSWMFERKGVIFVDAAGKDEDEVMLAAIDAGAEDVVAEGDIFEIRYRRGRLHDRARGARARPGSSTRSAELTMIPKNTVALDESDAKKTLRLLDALEDNDDVQEVYANFDIPDDVMEALAGEGRRLPRSGRTALGGSRPPAVILGLDPGLPPPGSGWSSSAGNRLRALELRGHEHAGGLPISSSGSTQIFDRDRTSCSPRYRPAATAVESLFFNVNVRTALAVGQARGVTLLACSQAGCDAVRVHAAAGEAGGRGLRQGQQASRCRRWCACCWPAGEIPRPDDAADALGVAICHANTCGIRDGVARRSREAGTARRGQAGPADDRAGSTGVLVAASRPARRWSWTWGAWASWWRCRPPPARPAARRRTR